jgi:hypothetical protein
MRAQVRIIGRLIGMAFSPAVRAAARRFVRRAYGKHRRPRDVLDRCGRSPRSRRSAPAGAAVASARCRPCPRAANPARLRAARPHAGDREAVRLVADLRDQQQRLRLAAEPHRRAPVGKHQFLEADLALGPFGDADQQAGRPAQAPRTPAARPRPGRRRRRSAPARAGRLRRARCAGSAASAPGASPRSRRRGRRRRC